MPQRPLDSQLANIIDKLAEFVARNGPEFEQMTKLKQQNNAKFSFLQNGNEFNAYYQFRVREERREAIGEMIDVCYMFKYSTCDGFLGMPQQPQNNFQQQQQQSIWSNNGNNGTSIGQQQQQQQPQVNFTAQIETINAKQMNLRDQIIQSESNLQAQHQVNSLFWATH